MDAAARRFFRLAKGVEIAAITVTKEQALDCQLLLAKGTPIDVGTARSNWRISIGRPLTGKIRAYVPYQSRHKKPYGSGGSFGESANVSAAQAQGRSKLASYKKGSIYISNALPYIGPLDRGHSPQSRNFVSRAVMQSLMKTAAKIDDIFDKEFSK